MPRIVVFLLLSAYLSLLGVVHKSDEHLHPGLVAPADGGRGIRVGEILRRVVECSYCQTLIRQPQETILVLISDLYEGGNSKEMVKRTANIVASGVQVIALLALSDEGAPAFDHNHAAAFAAMEVPAFACTPDLFPDLMATAIQRQNVSQWASTNGLFAERAKQLTR